jgi:hypothetical protein
VKAMSESSAGAVMQSTYGALDPIRQPFIVVFTPGSVTLNPLPSPSPPTGIFP